MYIPFYKGKPCCHPRKADILRAAQKGSPHKTKGQQGSPTYWIAICIMQTYFWLKRKNEERCKQILPLEQHTLVFHMEYAAIHHPVSIELVQDCDVN